MTMRSFLFPGQGSQVVGMGFDLYRSFSQAKEVFQEVDDALGEHLSKLIFSGEPNELTQTINAQPAIMTVAMACVRVLEAQSGRKLKDIAAYCAGHSLGEYTALCASESLDLATTARLLRLRGQAMQEAVPEGVGGMTALLGATIDQAEELCKKARSAGTLDVANDNAPGQIVISGHIKALEEAERISETLGIKRAIRLEVSAPFHSALIKPAELVMRDALMKRDDIKLPTINLVANVTAQTIASSSDIPEYLARQITGRVRWVESINYMIEKGVTEFIELGPGRVLTGLCKRISRNLTARSAETPKQIEALISCLEGS